MEKWRYTYASVDLSLICLLYTSSGLIGNLRPRPNNPEVSFNSNDTGCVSLRTTRLKVIFQRESQGRRELEEKYTRVFREDIRWPKWNLRRMLAKRRKIYGLKEVGEAVRDDKAVTTRRLENFFF